MQLIVRARWVSFAGTSIAGGTVDQHYEFVMLAQASRRGSPPTFSPVMQALCHLRQT